MEKEDNPKSLWHLVCIQLNCNWSCVTRVQLYASRIIEKMVNKFFLLTKNFRWPLHVYLLVIPTFTDSTKICSREK